MTHAKLTLKMITLILSVTMFPLNFIHAHPLESFKTYYKKGEKIQISWCNKHGWCKVKDKDFFVKEYKLKKIKESKSKFDYNVNTIGKTYLYLSDKYIQRKTNLWEYISNEVLSFNKDIQIDFKYDYTRISVVKHYLNLEKKYTKKIETKEINKKKEIKKIIKTVKKEEFVQDAFTKKDILPSKFFLAGSLAYSKLNISTSIPDNDLNKKGLDNTGFTYDLGIGYQYNNNIFTTVNIARTSLDIVDITNLYLTVNYQFNHAVHKPYIGFIYGYNDVKWRELPIKSSSYNPSHIKERGPLYGLQAGASQKINNHISVFTQYQFIKLEDDVYVLNNGTGLQHNLKNNFLIGFKYQF